MQKARREPDKKSEKQSRNSSTISNAIWAILIVAAIDLSQETVFGKITEETYHVAEELDKNDVILSFTVIESD